VVVRVATIIDRVSERKVRLFLCGGCRLYWGLLYDEASRESVEVSEQYADGRTDTDALWRANYSAECPTFGYDLDPNAWRGFGFDDGNLPPSVQRLLQMGILSETNLKERTEPADPEGWNRVQAAAGLAEWCSAKNLSFETLINEHFVRRMVQVGWPIADLLEEIFGKGFVSFDSRWRTSDVVGLAQAIYEDRAFDRLPLLADALMDAGCDHDDILAHCRGDGPHVRGCWVVDLALGKE
jgi:hypothetical protein